MALASRASFAAAEYPESRDKPLAGGRKCEQRHAANNSVIEGGTVKSVIADGQWHLYEWNFQDAAQWNSYSGGDGAITDLTVTIDAIRFTGTHDSTYFLDDVSHNPADSLVPLAGDFSHNYRVDMQDFDKWKAEFGATTNGSDFLAWQRGAHLTAAASAAVAPISEPTTATMLILTLTIFARKRTET